MTVADYDPGMTVRVAAQVVIDAVTDADGTSALKRLVTVAELLDIVKETQHDDKH